jgi:dienelactone hydrolase
MKLAATRRGYRIYRITYPSPLITPIMQNNTVPADYYLPDGIHPGSEPRPAVICVHILAGNYELVRILCASLASRGIPAVMFKLPYYGERALPGGELALTHDVERFAEAMSQAFLDVRRTVDMLAARPEVDPGRIGIAGISLGGIVSAAAAGVEPRLERAALLLAGGDLLSIIHHARETAELSQTLRGLPDDQRLDVERAILAADPLTHAAGLRERALEGKVLMINAADDQVIPPEATRKLATALGMSDRVEWLAGLGHYTALARLPEMVHQTVDYFAAGLPESAASQAAGRSRGTDPLIQIADLIAQAGSMISDSLDAHDAKQVEMHATVTDRQGKSYQAQFHLVRGEGNRFRLQWEVPLLGSATVGQDDYPWMATPVTLFRGTMAEAGLNGPSNRSPLALANPDYLARVRLVAGAMTTLPLAPRILEEVAYVHYEREADYPRAILIAPKQKIDPEDQARILFAADGITPQQITFDLAGFRGTVTIDAWQTHGTCDEKLFQPPADLTVQEVTPANVYRLFATLFNSAMRWTE